MLGLFSLLFAGGAAAKDAYDNAAMKNYSTEYDENGNRHCMDNRGNMYINGEKYIVKGYTDNDGVYHRQYIGVHSNKIYRDYVCPSEQLKNNMQMKTESITVKKDSLHIQLIIHDLREKLQQSLAQVRSWLP